MFSSIVKVITGWVRLRGSTDDTMIGNSGDSLKVNITNNIPTVTELYSGYSPDPTSYDTGNTGPLNEDASGNLIIRGNQISDEGSFRDDFSGTTLSTTLTGTVIFTNNSNIITGSGTAFTTQAYSGKYIKKATDADSLYVEIDYIISDTSLVLVSNYTGTTASVTGVGSKWLPSNTGGTSYTVGSSILNLISSTANGNVQSIQTNGDYLPFTLQMYASISQRIANQTAKLGFCDNIASPTKQAQFVFDGTVNTTVNARTSFSSQATDIQETTITLPNNSNTSTYHLYSIEVGPNIISFYIDGILMVQHTIHIPGPYDIMHIMAVISNTAAVASTTFSFDYVYFANWDRIQIDNDFKGEPITVQVTPSTTSTGANSVGRTELSNLAIAGYAFTTIVNTINSNSTETNLLLISNPSNAIRTVYISTSVLGVDPTSPNWVKFYAYVSPTVTSNGTINPITNLKAGVTNVSTASVYTSPVTSSRGTIISVLPVGNSNQSGATAPISLDPYLILSPGQSILIAAIAKGNNTPVVLNINWFES